MRKKLITSGYVSEHRFLNSANVLLAITSIKQLWSNLNHIFSFSKVKSRTSISKLIVNNTEVTTPRDICNCLNNYFCSVGENLAASIETGKLTSSDTVNHQ